MKLKIITYTCCILLFLLCVGCDDYSRTEVEHNIYVNKPSISAFVGEEIQLAASPTDGTHQFAWTSEDLSVATVANNGLVKLVGAGTTDIVVSSGDIKLRVPVTSIVRIPLQDVQLSEHSLEMMPENRKNIIITRIPDDANDVTVGNWTSEDSKIATVNEKGEIVAVSEGVTNIVYRIGALERKVRVDVSFTSPFKGPHVLQASQPYELPAANFDFGGLGYAFHDDVGNPLGQDNYRKANGDTKSLPVEIEGDGTNLGYINAGEWLQYTVEVKDAGEYLVNVSLSATAASSYRIEVDGKNETGTVSVPSNGSWSNWQWTPSTPLVLNLTEGKHKIKFYIEVSGFNLRALRFTKK